MISTRVSFALVILLAFSSTGCFWKKHPPALPAVPPPAPKPTAAPEPAPPPPKIDTTVSETIPPVSVKLPDVLKPPPTKPPPRRPRRNTLPAAVKPQTVPPGTDTPLDAGPVPAPAPKLGDLLTEAQLAYLLKKCDQTIQRVRTSLDSIATKPLSPESTESMGRVRVFLQQAEQTRGRDPQTALQLAHRAEVLVLDLLKSNR